MGVLKLPHSMAAAASPASISHIEQYFELTKKHRAETGPKTVVLIQCGKFLEIYGRLSDEDEKLSPLRSVSQLCALRVAKRSHDIADMRMAGVPMGSMDKYIEFMLDGGWTVAVYLQSTVPGRTDRSLTNVYTPGTFFSQNVGVSNNLLVIWAEFRPASVVRNSTRLLYGAACLDNMAGTVTLDETICAPLRNDSSDYDWVQELCIAYNPRELRIVAGNEHSERHAIVIERLALSVLPRCCVRRHAAGESNVIKAQKQVYQDEVVRKCYGSTQTPESLTLLNYPNATNAFTLLLAEANASDPGLTQRLARPIVATAVPRLLMANHSLRQLNIVTAGANGPNIRYSSTLRAICEGCFSNMGRREVARRINTPLVDSHAIDRRLQEVEYFVARPELLETIRKAVRGIPDAETDFRTVVHKVANPDMLACNLRQYFDMVIACTELLKTDDGLESAGSMGARLGAARAAADVLLAYTQNTFREEPVETVLLPDSKQEDWGIVARWLRPEADPSSEYSKAWAVYSAALESVEEVRGVLNYALRETTSSRTSSRGGRPGAQALMHLEDNKGAIVLRCTQHRGKQLQNWISRMKATADVHESIREELHISAIAGSNVRVENSYIAKAIKTLEDARCALAGATAAEYARVLEWYATHEGLIRDTVDFIGSLDAASTGARMAISNRYCRPEIAHDGDVSWFDAKGLRHMLAERIDSDELFVPNDLAFGGNAPASGLLLFGTNASGKSTLIKSVGIAVVLAQAGFYVPATAFTLRPYAAIYTRILGNDDLFRGLSTFAVEMTEFNAILRNANARTLVLGDELCSGTETVSAISIFASGLVSLVGTSCTHLFATHFHEVVRLPCVQALDRVVAKHLEVRYDADADALVYDRKLTDGPGDSIYGLEVCRSLKMPQPFLDKAYVVRAHLLPEGRSVLGAKTSRYSGKKVRGECELCGGEGAHVHHLVHQADADEGRMVDHVRVDAAANLINVCEPCHARLHEDGDSAVRHRKAKTVDGRTVLVGL